jgi:predicted house-cleaning noncanonical NTP pyrophosphatase (MazG superfamily)
VDGWPIRSAFKNKNNMKIPISFIITLTVILHGHAIASQELEESHKERKKLLEAIVKYVERQYSEGHCGLMNVIDEKIRLDVFQQEIASDVEQKKKFQSNIVKFEKIRLDILQKSYAGEPSKVTLLDIMRARDRYLEARQRLFEIGSNMKKVTEQDSAHQSTTRSESKPK